MVDPMNIHQVVNQGEVYYQKLNTNMEVQYVQKRVFGSAESKIQIHDIKCHMDVCFATGLEKQTTGWRLKLYAYKFDEKLKKESILKD
jgi:hypothetical protein